jgi:FtsP/CotA-like multicopper oxidase with cupredoxin domain
LVSTATAAKLLRPGIASFDSPALTSANELTETPSPDYTLRITAAPIELSRNHIVSAITYNGQFPGPLLRFKAGQQVVVDVHNDTETPEQLHWHGKSVPVEVDGAAEEATPFIPAHGTRRIIFTPRPAGFRLYHTHNRGGADLHAAQYSGPVGPVYIEPRHESGDYDREVFLMLKEFEPFLSRGNDMPMNFLAPAAQVSTLREAGESAMKASLAKGTPHRYEVGYRYFSINGRMLGHGEPVRVKTGERILFHVLNGSATEIRSLALPGHLQGLSFGWQSRAESRGSSSALARHRRANFGDRGHETSGRLGNG